MLQDFKANAVTHMQGEIDRMTGEGVIALIFDKAQKYIGYSFLTQAFEVLDIQQVGSELTYLIRTRPVNGEPKGEMYLNITEAKPTDNGFRLEGTDYTWDCRTNLTEHNRKLLGIKSS